MYVIWAYNRSRNTKTNLTITEVNLRVNYKSIRTMLSKTFSVVRKEWYQLPIPSMTVIESMSHVFTLGLSKIPRNFFSFFLFLEIEVEEFCYHNFNTDTCNCIFLYSRILFLLFNSTLNLFIRECFTAQFQKKMSTISEYALWFDDIPRVCFCKRSIDVFLNLTLKTNSNMYYSR